MDGAIEGQPTATYLWNELQVVPFLKVDKGLADEENGVQLMKPMPELDALLARANDKGIYGTKMRSTINSANAEGIAAVVAQQFEVGKQILAAGLMPIIEPEVNINAADKAECEALLKAAILKQLDALDDGQEVMLKLTLPEAANFYAELIAHDKVLLVVALSGGYDLAESCSRLAANNGMVASFSRALSNDLQAQQSDDEFNTALSNAIEKIYAASLGTAESKAA
jgi:fructose-bisphosphate aldolase class I